MPGMPKNPKNAALNGLSALFVLLPALLAGCNTLLPRQDSAAAAPIAAEAATTETVSAPVAAAEPSLAEQAAFAVETAVREEASLETAAPEAPPQPRDLWARIRAGMALPGSDDPRTQRELAWFATHQGYLDRVADRAEPFLYDIVEAVEARGLPMELALLPVVESAFQPFAYSHGRAAGIWQFIPATGRRYGLKQNWWYDGRRDVPAATRAALDYLEALRDEFDGDWLLALAAYNSGEGKVRSAVRRNARKGKPTDFWHLDLPRETRAYVPKLLALAALVAGPDRHGVTLRGIADEPFLTAVEVGSQIDLALAADLAGLPLDDLYRLNPAFNRWATDPDGPHALLVPVDRAAAFREELEKLPAEKRLKWQRHRIGEGETLSQIAERYGTTVATLKKVNRLRGTGIRAGKHLIIPVASRSLASYRLTEDRRQAALQNTPRSGAKTHYTVRDGDTLWDIARDHGVRVASLAKWNGIAPRDTIKPGQELVIWTTAANASQGAIAAPATGTVPADSVRRIRYVVRSGDSLARISQRFQVSIAELCKWNRISRDDYLQPGQRLLLYVDVTRQTGSI